MSNKFTLKQGAVGTTIEFTLSDANGPVDLTGWAVTMTARKGTVTAIDGGICTITDAEAGQGEYEFDAESAGIAVGEYKLEFKGTVGSDVYYFPTNRTNPYGKLYVIASLG